MNVPGHSLLKHSILLASVVAAASGCVRTVQAWPPPITAGSTVDVRFAVPRLVVFERGLLKDSVARVRELRGAVLAVHNDTLVLLVSGSQSANATGSRTVERRATIALDQSTLVTTSEVDGWKFAYALLAGCVLIFAAAVLSGS